MKNFRMAAPELANIQIQGMTRQTFVARAALAGGAVYGAAAVGPFVRNALAQATDGREGAGDVGILNFALTLEFLEAAFYTQALEKVPNLRGDLKKLTEELRTNEEEHVTGITAVIKSLGGKPVTEPQVDFGNAFSSVENYLDLAETFEDTGVSAYNGAGPMIQSKDVLATAFRPSAFRRKATCARSWAPTTRANRPGLPAKFPVAWV